MWDANCEEKARMLLAGFIAGFIADPKKPPLEEQQEVANWLNQMLPYPGWRFELSLGGGYWTVNHGTLGTVVVGLYEDDNYTHSDSEVSTDTLI